MTRTSWNCARNLRQAGTGWLRGQFVSAAALEPGARRGGAQPCAGVGLERRDHLLDRQAIGRDGVRRSGHLSATAATPA